MRQDQYICLLQDSCEKKIASICENMREKISGLLKHEVLAAISAPLNDYLEINSAYTDVQEMFIIRKRKKITQPLLFVEKLKYEQILLHISQSQEVKNFIDDKLSALEIYDKKHDSHLLETILTLATYFGSRKETANAMFLHRNTLSYRLQQIEKIFGYDIHDLEQFDQLEFICKLKTYM